MKTVELDLSRVETEELARTAIMASALARFGGRRRPPFERLMSALSRQLVSEFRGRLLFGVPSKLATVKLPAMTGTERVAVLREVQRIERKFAQTGTTAHSIFETLVDALASNPGELS